MSNLKKLSLEELLETVETSGEDVQTQDFQDDVVGFLNVLNIETGEQSIKATLIYSIYRAWSKNPIQRLDFINRMKDFIKSDKKDVTFFINQNAAKLTHSAYKKFKTQSRIKSPAWQKRFKNFMDYYSLKTGDTWINDRVFYLIYDHYRIKQNLICHQAYLSKETFYMLADINVPFKITAKGKLYGVSDNIVLLVEAIKNEAQKEAEKEDKKKRTKKS